MKRLFSGVSVALMIFGMAAFAHASVFPGPGQDGHEYLHVGDPVDGSKLFNGELVSISSTHLQIENNSGGTSVGPDLWLVLGIPGDNGSGGVPDATTVDGVFSGVFKDTLDPGEDLYGDIFDINGGGSQSFTNWSDALLALTGDSATKFGIYVYDFNVTLADKQIYDVNFSLPGLSAGTFAVAIADLNTTVGGPNGPREVFATTPFTETGFFRVPEPGMLVLFGSGLLGLGLFGRKRFGK